MGSNDLDGSVTPKRRKPRPSRGRGLRTTAGCMTCRSRRLKCDETKPNCGQCIKASRDCVFASAQQASELSSSTSPKLQPIHTAQQPSNGALKLSDLLENATPGPSPSELGSPLTTASSFTSGNAPHYWYDLIAQDAVKNIENYNFLTTSGARWSFGPQQSAFQHGQPNEQAAVVVPLQHSPKTSRDLRPAQSIESGDDSSYNTTEPPVLREYELRYLQYYLDVVAPILDLFDSQQHFKTHVLHLALRNVGLLKSVLALSALHKARCAGWEGSPTSAGCSVARPPDGQPMPDQNMATQYYYETLNYLSQAMQYPGYPHSQEILANAALISWYEALDTEASANWERHLKGVFWIQRSQNTDGENSGLPRAVWWNWLRQDIWAAFRHHRKTLTIWRPKKMLPELGPEDLACRALYLLAKAVGYASDEVRESLDFTTRIHDGNLLLDTLQEWYILLPRIFRPLPAASDSGSRTTFPSIWIHPPMFAAAMQAFYSAKILVLLNRPSLGGREAYHNAQRSLEELDECITSICGIASGPNSKDISLAFFNFQALFFGKAVFCNTQNLRVADNSSWTMR